MRSIAMVVLLGAIACGGAPPREPEHGSETPEGALFNEPARPVSDRRFREGPGGFPIPADATLCQDMPNGDLTCAIPHPRDAIHDLVTGRMRDLGFTIRYTAADGHTLTETKTVVVSGYRMYFDKPPTKYFVSVTTNDDSSSLLTITVK